jgi:L-alanine-DL-glutamate epimerase-like enolase superfamily enzyme
MSKRTDVRPVAAKLYLLPVKTRVPLKFGPETLTSVTCARVCLTVEDRAGARAEGWGETPLSVQWTWPSTLSLAEREDALQRLCRELAKSWATVTAYGHPIETGHEFTESSLREALHRVNASREGAEPIPWLAALVCSSAFDIALHDAFGNLHNLEVYKTYNGHFMTMDLDDLFEPVPGAEASFRGKHPEDFLTYPRPDTLRAWHLVGGKDLLDASERTGEEPDDGYPVLLSEWIQRDGLNCLKVKLRGDDSDWDYDRIQKVGSISIPAGVEHLTVDFNCTVTDPTYVNAILDRLEVEHPGIHARILYVEQPFPYDLEENQIDVHSVSARKPLFMDESAHDWRLVALGRSLGWTGVALKTCKTQTGALLSLCWARAHGMALMVQDLTNPMLAQIPHVLLAAHASTIMGVETNAMQFYPDASLPEAQVHPGLYRRRNGRVELSTLEGPGFGYRREEVSRELPPPEVI